MGSNKYYNLEKPIKLINLEEYGIDVKDISDKLKTAYETDYEWDYYLLRQNKIEFLKRNLQPDILNQIPDEFWESYYNETILDLELSPILENLSRQQFEKFSKIRPTRKRLVSEYNLIYSDDSWKISRVPSKPFGQDDALISLEDAQDYRLARRIFKEVPKSLEYDFMHELMNVLADDLRISLPSHPTSLNIVFHYTVIYCFQGINGTNSPEGIHQDGMDHIVSALVIERNGIKGGKSIVYEGDAETELFEVTLQAGQGIFQPDKNTDLWHTVTPISCLPDKATGYRSSIGLDITIL